MFHKDKGNNRDQEKKQEPANNVKEYIIKADGSKYYPINFVDEPQEKKRNYILRYFYILLLLSVFGLSLGLGVFKYFGKEVPPLSELKHYDMRTGSEVYDINDNLIYLFAGVEANRKLVSINDLPDYVVNALLAIEDSNFYEHWGVDLKANLRAIYRDLLEGSFKQGASTITQQVSRNMFLTLDKNIIRKIKEVILSIRIEKMYSKDEILEMYFNKVCFGPGLFGIEAAAKKYFGKSAKDLTLSEGALIVGITQLPSYYYPVRHPDRAVRKRNIVIKRMLDENFITQAQYEIAIQDSLVLFEKKHDGGAKDYFIEHIRKKLEEKYGSTKLFAGGLKIYTTLDLDLQVYADSILNQHLIKFEEKNDYEIKYSDFPKDTIDIVTPYVQGAVFCIESQTGYVKTIIGGRNFNHSKFNRMTQAVRQPGSCFKPILYSTALINGYTPATVIKDEPVMYVQSDTLFWEVHNYSKKYFGYTRMRDALKFSRNIYAVKMITDIGPKVVVEYAKRFGLTKRVYPYYSLAIGTCEVIPYQLISSFTTFANGGERVTPIFVRRVEDEEGNILEENLPQKIRVIDEKIAFLMANMMQSVLDEGTGRGVRWRGYRWAGAGKTGTTDNFNDAWFIGYNKQLVTGIWVGFDDNTSLGNSQTGASAALPAWPYIMKRAIENESPKNSKGQAIIDGKKLEFDRPMGIIQKRISKKTGLLPVNDLEDTIDEYFIAGTEPTPLSDTLSYNFLPTMYRENEQDSTVFNLGGKPVIVIDTLSTDSVRVDTLGLDLSDIKMIDLYKRKK